MVGLNDTKMPIHLAFVLILNMSRIIGWNKGGGGCMFSLKSFFFFFFDMSGN